MIYQAFFGLTDMPFRPTPDPRYLFASGRHRLALSQLTYAVGARTGPVVLTGEVGTGKTTLLRTLLQGLDPAVPVAYVHNAALTMEGLVEYMLGDWGVSSSATTHAERLSILDEFLLGHHQRGLRPLLVIDAEPLNAGLPTPVIVHSGGSPCAETPTGIRTASATTSRDTRHFRG